MMRREIPLRPPLRSGPGGVLAGLLVLADLALIALHVGGDALGQPRDWPWWVDVDGGYPEFLQYVKLLWVVLLLGIVWLRWRRGVWLTLAATALALLADDALGLHEEFGPVVGALVPLPAALADYANDIGEALVMAAMGGVLLLAILVGYRVADPRSRDWLRPIIGLLVLLAAFAGVVDPLHQTTEGLLYDAVTVVEDGGEMIVVSLLAATGFHTAVHAAGLTNPPPGRAPRRPGTSAGAQRRPADVGTNA